MSQAKDEINVPIAHVSCRVGSVWYHLLECRTEQCSNQLLAWIGQYFCKDVTHLDCFVLVLRALSLSLSHTHTHTYHTHTHTQTHQSGVNH